MDFSLDNFQFSLDSFKTNRITKENRIETLICVIKSTKKTVPDGGCFSRKKFYLESLA